MGSRKGSRSVPSLVLPVGRVALSGDGKRVLCAMNNGVIRGWSTINGISLADLVGHKGAVLAISMNLDGTRAISTGEDRSLRLWNVNTGAPMRVFEGHTKTHQRHGDGLD